MMCGILGTINRSFDKKVLELINHRGPDDNEIVKMDIMAHITDTVFADDSSEERCLQGLLIFKPQIDRHTVFQLSFLNPFYAVIHRLH